MEISYFNIQNDRKYQEDYFTVKTLADGTIFAGVFDGHGGNQASEYANKKALYAFKAMKRLYPTLTNSELLVKTTARLHDITRHYYERSCVGMVAFDSMTNIASIAILGDCSVLAKTVNGIEQTSDHNIRTNSKEREMAWQRGAIVYQGYMFSGRDDSYNGGLQPTRSLGDKGLDDVLLREPEIAEYTIAKDGWILLATDGVLNSKYSKDAVIVQMRNSLISSVENGGKASVVIPFTFQDDNATAILIRK